MACRLPALSRGYARVCTTATFRMSRLKLSIAWPDVPSGLGVFAMFVQCVQYSEIWSEEGEAALAATMSCEAELSGLVTFSEAQSGSTT